MLRSRHVLSPILALVLVAGCGGGGGDGNGGGGVPVSTGLPGIASFEGFVTASGGVSTGVNAFVGDTVVNNVDRGFLSFDLTQIPPGSTITTATLHVYQHDALGTPFLNLGNVLVDHFDAGVALDSTDYSGTTIQSNFGTLSMSPTEGARTLDVTTRVQDDVTNNRPRTDLRLRFITGTDNDNSTDAVTFQWSDPAADPSLRPYIAVTFVAP